MLTTEVRSAEEWFRAMFAAVNGGSAVKSEDTKITPPPKDEDHIHLWEERDHNVAGEIRRGEWK